MSDEEKKEQPLAPDDPNYGTVDDPGFEDPYAHLRDKEKELGGPVEAEAEPEPEVEKSDPGEPSGEGTGGDQAGL